MIKSRYKKLSGMHVGHVYQVAGPANEMDSPMRWSLHGETVVGENLIVAEDELTDTKRWQPLD